MENAGVEGTAYYDGQFKTRIPEGLIRHYRFLKPFSDQLSSPALYRTSQFINILSQVSSIDQRYNVAYKKPAVTFISLTTALNSLALPSTKRYQAGSRTV